MQWRAWRRHFEANDTRPLPQIDPPALPAAVLEPLRVTIAKLQLGETGEGRIAKQIDHVAFVGVDDDYRQSVKLFIKEEGRHARILGDALRAVGGRPLVCDVGSQLFTWARRLAGVRMKLLVMLVAEIVGITCYGAIVGALPASSFRRALEGIHSDETFHLPFHCDFFRSQVTSGLGRAVFGVLFWTIGVCALLTVLAEHRRTFGALGVPIGAVTGRFVVMMRRSSDQVSSARNLRCGERRALCA